jgi:hypothetical protein
MALATNSSMKQHDIAASTYPPSPLPACGVCSPRGHRYWAGSELASYEPCKKCPRSLSGIVHTPHLHAVVPPDQHLFPALGVACEVCHEDGPICRCGAHWKTHVGAVMWQCQREYRCKGARFYHEKCLLPNEKRPRITNEGIICNECYRMRHETDHTVEYSAPPEGLEGRERFVPQAIRLSDGHEGWTEGMRESWLRRNDDALGKREMVDLGSSNEAEDDQDDIKAFPRI